MDNLHLDSLGSTDHHTPSSFTPSVVAVLPHGIASEGQLVSVYISASGEVCFSEAHNISVCNETICFYIQEVL